MYPYNAQHHLPPKANGGLAKVKNATALGGRVNAIVRPQR